MPQTPSRSRPSLCVASAKGKRFVLLAAAFNPAITRALVQGAVSALRRHGAAAADIQVLWVPGAFELPVVAARVAAAKKHPDAVIALGALIRGETPQYDVIAHAVAQGLEQVAVAASIPVTFGVIVATSFAHAKARASRTGHNRGTEAALAAVAVLRMFDRLKV